MIIDNVFMPLCIYLILVTDMHGIGQLLPLQRVRQLYIQVWATLYTGVGNFIYRGGQLYTQGWTTLYTGVDNFIYRGGQLYIQGWTT